MKNIYFYSPKGRNGYLANFSRHSIRVNGEYWRTVEHFFQAQKFSRSPEILRAIRAAKTPHDAKEIARKHKQLCRSDWPDIREGVMRTAIWAKFEQHPILAEKLLATGRARIVEDASDEPFWGTGVNGQGLNRMGELLMELRDQLAPTHQKQPNARYLDSNEGDTNVK